MWLNRHVFPTLSPMPRRHRHPSSTSHYPPIASASRPLEDDLEHCQRRIREEEALAGQAGTPEAGLVHEQVAMLYRSQLATLLRHQDQLQATDDAG